MNWLLLSAVMSLLTDSRKFAMKLKYWVITLFVMVIRLGTSVTLIFRFRPQEGMLRPGRHSIPLTSGINKHAPNRSWSCMSSSIMTCNAKEASRKGGAVCRVGDGPSRVLEALISAAKKLHFTIHRFETPSPTSTAWPLLTVFCGWVCGFSEEFSNMRIYKISIRTASTMSVGSRDRNI